MQKSSAEELTEQSQQAHGGEDRLPDQLHMRRLGVVDLETGGQGSLCEGKGVVTKEGIVVAKEGVVDGAVGVSEQQVLVLLDHLVNIRSSQHISASPQSLQHLLDSQQGVKPSKGPTTTTAVL